MLCGKASKREKNKPRLREERKAAGSPVEETAFPSHKEVAEEEERYRHRVMKRKNSCAFRSHGRERGCAGPGGLQH